MEYNLSINRFCVRKSKPFKTALKIFKSNNNYGFVFGKIAVFDEKL